MPRDGLNVYHLPFPDVVSATTIVSPVYNGFTNDIAQDLNLPRPIVAGGTNATTPDAALASLSAEKASQLVTNFDSMVWIPGSFYAAAAATSAPTVNACSGIVYQSDSSNIVLEAIDSVTGIKYLRRKIAGTWGAWSVNGSVSFQPRDPQLFAGIPINPVAATYTAVATDAQTCLYTVTPGSVVTIPTNASVPFPLGTCLSFANATTAVTIACGDTLTWNNGSTGLTGSRTLGIAGIATALKVATTSWFISGGGLS